MEQILGENPFPGASQMGRFLASAIEVSGQAMVIANDLQKVFYVNPALPGSPAMRPTKCWARNSARYRL